MSVILLYLQKPGDPELTNEKNNAFARSSDWQYLCQPRPCVLSHMSAQTQKEWQVGSETPVWEVWGKNPYVACLRLSSS